MVESRDLCLPHLPTLPLHAFVRGKGRDLCLPHLHSTPLLGRRVPSEYCHNFWCGKTTMVSLFEQILKIIVFILTEYMNVTDGQSDTVMA